MRGEGPLRYPGAKANLAHLVAAFMQRHNLVGMHVVEPFAGSAAVSRLLLARKIAASAELWELDPGAYAFWHSILNATEDLKDRVKSSPVTLEEFDRHTEYLGHLSLAPTNIVEAGFAFLFLNRTSYSGIVGAGPIGGRGQTSKYPLDCRFTKSTILSQIDKLAELRDRVTIKFGDGINEIGRVEDAFYYVDPPYFTNGKKFYRKYFDLFEHYRLRKSLSKSHRNWLLSYDYDQKVEYLYRYYPMADVSLYHSVRQSGSKQELLVSPLGFANVVDTTNQARRYPQSLARAA